MAGGEILTRYAPLRSARPGRSEARESAARTRRRRRLRCTAEPTSRPMPKPMRGGSTPPSRRYRTEIPPARTVRPLARRRSNVVRSRIRQIRPRVAFGPLPCATAPQRGRLCSTCGAGNHGVWPAYECSVGMYASSHPSSSCATTGGTDHCSAGLLELDALPGRLSRCLTAHGSAQR